MEGPQPDPEQTERLLFFSSQADDKFSTTINEFYASVRQQCQTTKALHVFSNGSLSPSQTNRLFATSQKATADLQDCMHALYQCFEEQKDAKAKALSSMVTLHSFFRDSNALLLKESSELIAQDNELQNMHRTTHSECEGLKKQVASLEAERTNLLDRATTAEQQQSVLQVQIDHTTRQYNQSRASILGLEGQVRQLDHSLVDDRNKLEDEKRRSAELQTSIGLLQSNVETLERALSQSNDCLKVHVAHVDTQQTMNDGLKGQVQELKSSLESTRSELDDKKREIADQQDAVMRLDLKVKELEQTLQSTRDCLAIEKSLSNAGQASTAALTGKVQELEHLFKNAHQKIRTEKDRHVAQKQNLERSLDLSNNSLEAYMDRCNSQQASIDKLSHETQCLTKSLGAAQKALEVERQQSAVRQASVEELQTTAKELEFSLHMVSDCLQDEKSRCNVHRASVSSLTANARNLEQSLHLANMEFEKHKRQNREYIVSTEGNVLKLEKTLDLTRKDLGDKSIRCIAQAASIVGLNNQIQGLEEANQAIRGDLNLSRQRCDAQQLYISGLEKRKQELETSLQASRDDLKDKAQLYSSQQPFIDSLKDTERELQRSLQASQKETEAEKERCTAQQSLVAEMENKLRELKVELESTQTKVERVEQPRDTRDDGVSDLTSGTQQLEESVDRNAAGMEFTDEDTMPDGLRTRQLAQATGEGSGGDNVAHMYQDLEGMTETPQIDVRMATRLGESSLGGELSSRMPAQDLSELPSQSGKNRTSVRTCPDSLESEMAYNLMVVRSILRHLSPCDGIHASLVSETGPNSGSGDEDTGVPSRFLGIKYPKSSADGEQDQVSNGSENKYACCGYCAGKWGGGKVCLDNTQFSEIHMMVGREAFGLHREYDKLWPLEDTNHKSPEWLRSTTRAVYPGASDEKTLAALSFIDQHVRALLRGCSNPRDPKKGLKIIKERVALYRSEWYQAASTKDEPTLKENPPRANTARKRHNNDDLEVDTQRQTKRRPGTPAANAPDVSTVSDTLRRQSDLAKQTEAEKQQHDLTTSNNVQNTMSTHDSHMAKKLAYLEQIRRSPWALDTSESAQHFIESLTPALCVNVLFRLVELSRTYSVQQVVLHIDLEQLHTMGGRLEGSSVIPPIVESDFAITERHISIIPKLSFNKARLDKLLKYRLDSARFGPELDGKTLGLKPSGLFTLVSRQDPLTTAKKLRKCFDAETVAAIRAAATTQAATIWSHESEESTHPSGRPEHAPVHHDTDVRARLNLGVQSHGRLTRPTRQATSNQVDRLRGQHQTDIMPIAVEIGSGGGGSGRAKANDQLNDASKDNADKIPDTGHPRNATATSKVQRTTRSKKKNKSSRGTTGENGRPKRTPKPSRRAAEAASARQG
jgi:hypothetical protein